MIRTIVAVIFFISMNVYGQPKISFSFDDGKEWNETLLNKMDSAHVKAIFFVAGRGKVSKRGHYLLKSWNDKGHLIANHTFSHPNYNDDDTSFKLFSNEILKNDRLIRKYSNYVKFFRFPYLKEGNTVSKVDSIRKFLHENEYRNGYVTIDASDWYIDSRLLKRLRKDPSADTDDFKSYYLNHLWEKAQYYEKLSYEINGRHINHTLLLHHNLAASLFIDDLIKMFKDKGWQIVSAKEAYKDPIYKKVPRYAGESLIYALARDSGKFNHLLRFPAEDSQYEKKKMDKLGL